MGDAGHRRRHVEMTVAEHPIPWLRRVRLRNFRSIASCDVELGPLTVLVGPNGSGKSNFLDALRFVRDAVSTTPYQAIEARGWLEEILCRVPTRGGSIRIDGYLASVAPYVDRVDRRFAGDYVTVETRQSTGPDGTPIVFGPNAMSDGTIRAAGILGALFQLGISSGRVSLVGIEEPEAALHPAAAGVLFDALTEASEDVQVLVTTQSDDLLDRDDVDHSVIRAVRSAAGRTMIGPLNEAVIRALKTHRFTAGELMRAGQLQPVNSRQRDAGNESVA